MTKLIKSKARVKQYGEVFTPSHIVSNMMNRLPSEAYDLNKRWLEPTVGEGVFLTFLLAHRLENIEDEYEKRDYFAAIFDALSSMYGIDIQRDNVVITRSRLRKMVEDFLKAREWRFSSSEWQYIDKVLENNIICGDTLKGDFPISFFQRDNDIVTQAMFLYSDLMNSTSEPKLVVKFHLEIF
ncbi:hypothetical protein HPC38_02515 [Pasteurellaceae bacterium HPA106]|uniref:hypothetical protein n=1 Tax=Spirabiliibacterium pneumoniae TaxID=221400 RepID=UPI001AACE92A|nr:hypothetical protein [Spirabiliibacterium pneumoniae]MBE2895753.1 hypothetical protein [Spirabiliibacterium pneumoniae]